MTEQSFKERPILFNDEMVKQILAGNKTQTRRLLKPSPPVNFMQGQTKHYKSKKIKDGGMSFYFWHTPEGAMWPETSVDYICPYGQVGDQLWVREAWRKFNSADECGCSEPCLCPSTGTVIYRATNPDREAKWKPSIHFRREYSRIQLEITEVRVERLNDISEEDCWKEGIKRSTESPTQAETVHSYYASPKRAFCLLWESIHGRESWCDNPWVWVVEFKVIKS